MREREPEKRTCVPRKRNKEEKGRKSNQRGWEGVSGEWGNERKCLGK